LLMKRGLTVVSFFVYTFFQSFLSGIEY